MTTIRLAGFAGLLALTWHTAATAQGVYSEGWYVGLSGDTTQVSVHESESRESGGDARGRSLRGGVRLDRRFGIEIGLHEAGDLTWTEHSTSVPALHNASTTFDVRTLEVSGVWAAPICRLLESNVRGGLTYYDLAGRRTLAGGFRTPASSLGVSDEGFGYTVSFGFAVKPTDKLRVRFEYQVFDIDEDFLSAGYADDATIDTVSIGLDYRLGRSER